MGNILDSQYTLEELAIKNTRDNIQSIVSDSIINVLVRHSANSLSTNRLTNEMNLGGVIIDTRIGKQAISTNIDLTMLLDQENADKIQNEAAREVLDGLSSKSNSGLSNNEANQIYNMFNESFSTKFSTENVITMVTDVYASNKLNIPGVVIGSNIEGQDIITNIVMKSAKNVSNDILSGITNNNKNTEVYHNMVKTELEKLKKQQLNNLLIGVLIFVFICITIIGIIIYKYSSIKENTPSIKENTSNSNGGYGKRSNI